MALAFTLAPTGHTESLTDPTRPPASIALPSAAVKAQTPGSLVLQSTLISRRTKVAVIDGQRVSVGDKMGDATVVKISEGEVVLRNDAGLVKLQLFPAVEKRTIGARKRAP